MEDGIQSSQPVQIIATANYMTAGEAIRNPLSHPCPHCNQSYSTHADLINHIERLHPDVTGKPHQCVACLKAYEYPSQLKNHIQRAHSKDKAHHCPKCEYKCKSLSDLKSHLKRHKENRERFKCSICGKDYAMKHGLTYHLTTKHGSLNNEGYEPGETKRDPLPHTCPHCNQSFSEERILNEHINCVHSSKVIIMKSHQCHACLRVYEFPSWLKRHVLQAHSVDKPHKCHKCKFRCKLISELNQHLKRHEDKREKFKCSNCDKEYSTKASLKLHLIKKHRSFNTEAHILQDMSNTNEMNEKYNQGVASGGIMEAAMENIPITVSLDVQSGLVTDNYYLATEAGCAGSETTENGCPFGVCQFHCGNMYASEEDLKKHHDIDHKLDVSAAETAMVRASKEFGKVASLSYLSFQYETFTATNPTPGPSNAQQADFYTGWQPYL